MVGVSSIVLGSRALDFAVSMVVITIGELLIAPTFTSLVANLTPDEIRGRYVGVYWIGWSFSRGIGPAIAGRVYDNVSPGSIWYLGGMWNLLAAIIFALLSRRWPRRRAHPVS